MSEFRKHEALEIAEAWLKDEPCRNPDELVNEQRMAAMLLLAIEEIDLLERSKAFYVEACGAHQLHIDELQAIVDRLPKTADGVPVEQTSMGVKVWRHDGPEERPQQCRYYQNGFAVFDSRIHFRGELLPIPSCYSSKEAAEKARQSNA